MNNHPIGILDSGLGGLTVWKEVASFLPQESTVYIGDSLHAPYGARSQDDIFRLSKKLIEFLLTKQVKLIVLACNTITVSCLEKLRRDYPDVPIVGTVPVIKTAAAITKNKRIGILSTTHTAASQYQKKLITQFAHECVVFNRGTDELVPLIEEGKLGGKKLEKLLHDILRVFQQKDVDTIVLGCTHFPFLREQMQEVLGSTIHILDSGPAIARQVKRILENNKIMTNKKNPQHTFYTTGDPAIAKKLLQSTIGEKEMSNFSHVSL